MKLQAKNIGYDLWLQKNMRLMEEINEDREKHGKKPFSDNNNDPPKTRIVNESTTDADCGVFHKGEHKKQFAYEAHTACDKNGYILDVEVTAGNVHDSVAFELYYDHLTERFPQIRFAVMDAGYKTPAIARKVLESNRIPVLPYKRPNEKMILYLYSTISLFFCPLAPKICTLCQNA